MNTTKLRKKLIMSILVIILSLAAVFGMTAFSYSMMDYELPIIDDCSDAIIMRHARHFFLKYLLDR
ncbi:MAG: hypothetical protein FWE03_05585 [Firmicutes bacterium]|nr:hypothetical protein [Bacillota bacterium]